MFSRLFIYSFVVCVASAAAARGSLPIKPIELGECTSFPKKRRQVSQNIIDFNILTVAC